MRRTFTSSLSVLMLSFASFGLIACSTDDVPPPPCPTIQIIADGAKLTRFKPGPGRDIIDVLHEEEITGFAQACEYDTDETGAGDVRVLLAPTILSSRGPANQTGDADFEYFIAVTDSNKKVLDKERFAVVLPYPQSLPRLTWQREDPHNLILPLKAGQTGQDYQIYIGLQLSRPELDYQRKNR